MNYKGRLRRAVMWAVACGLWALAGLSVYGAFLGADRAGEFFNSTAMKVCWGVVLAGLIVGVFAFRVMYRRVGLLAIHVGVVLILVGAIWGSSTGHRFHERLFGEQRIRCGFMLIGEGSSDNRIFCEDLAEPIGELDFEVKLERFDIEYYEQDGARWTVHAGVVGADGQMVPVEWHDGRWVDVPLSGAQVRVVQYLTEGRRADQPTIELRSAGGQVHTMPAVVGSQLHMDQPHAVVKVVRVFANLRVMADGDELRAIDVPGAASNPAAEVVIESCDGEIERRFAFVGSGVHRDPTEGIALVYLPGADQLAGHDDVVPAVELEFKLGDEQRTVWLTPMPGANCAYLPLAAVFADCAGSDDGSVGLFLVAPQRDVKDYKSSLAILRDGRQVADKVIEVNDPLGFGGYQFYQHSYDPQAGRYTILAVVSDLGVSVAFVGFALLAGGCVWHFWVSALWGARR